MIKDKNDLRLIAIPIIFVIGFLLNFSWFEIILIYCMCVIVTILREIVDEIGEIKNKNNDVK